MGLDYVYSSANAKYVEVCKNALQAMLDGTSFMDGTDVIKVIGTNGTRKVIPVETFQDFMYMFYQDALLVNPSSDNGDGKPVTQANTVLNAYDDVITVMVEMVHASGSKKQGVRVACVGFNNPTVAEGTDTNKFNVSGVRYCDVRYIDKYFIDGITAAQTPIGAIQVYGINCALNIEVAVPAVPTVTGVPIDSYVSVTNTTTGAVHLWLFDGVNFTENTTATANTGCKLFATKYATVLNSTYALATSNYNYVAIKTAGVFGSAMVVTDKTLTSGSGTASYIYKIKDFQFSDGTWINYAG